MAEHHNDPAPGKSGGGVAWLGYLLGIILIGLGATVLKDFSPPIPGLELNLGKTMAMIGLFLLLFPVIRMFYVQPLQEAITSRNSELESTFTEAEELRARMTAMKSEYEQRLAETEARAREQIQAQIKEAQALGAQLRAEAAETAEEMVRKAQQEIEGEKHRVMTELRLEVVNLTLGATEKLLGENVDSDKNRQLVNEFLDKVEVPG